MGSIMPLLPLVKIYIAALPSRRNTIAIACNGAGPNVTGKMESNVTEVPFY